MTSGNMTVEISNGDRFFHVINEYRCLAFAGSAWRLFGPTATPASQRPLQSLLPGAHVIIQDSLLAHARVLIDFYSMPKKGTDIVLADFPLPPLSATRLTELQRYKTPIDVHLLHMTAWRDSHYRRQQRRTVKGGARQRPDWDNDRIVSQLLRALELVSRSRRIAWAEPFRFLHQAARELLANPASPWPRDLTERVDLKPYLASLGLA